MQMNEKEKNKNSYTQEIKALYNITSNRSFMGILNFHLDKRNTFNLTQRTNFNENLIFIY